MKPLSKTLTNYRDMNEEALKEVVNKIISMKHDDEAAHSAEDELHLKIIREFCPSWVVSEIERLENTDFERWCA